MIVGGSNPEINKGSPTITPTLEGEKLTNNLLETWASPTDLNVWTEGVGGTSTVNQETTVVHSGSNACRLDIDAINTAAYISQATSGILEGDWIQMQSWFQTPGSTKTIKHVLGAVSGLSRGPVTYTQCTDVIRAAAANPNLIIMRDAAASASLYVDDCSLQKITFSSTLAFLGALNRVYGKYQCSPTVEAGTQAGIVFRYKDASNYLIAYVDRRNATANIDQCAAGTITNLATGAITYSAERILQVFIDAAGTTAKLYYNAAQVGSDGTITATDLGNSVYGFNTYSGNTAGVVSTSKQTNP